MDSIANDVKDGRWLCFQIGAREHYAIPRALHADGRLEALVTDYWKRQTASLSYSLAKNLQGRRHPDLPDKMVKSFNMSSLTFEVLNKITRTAGWGLVMKRNHWFQRKALDYLKSVNGNVRYHVFTYSYAAKDILTYAKSRGWATVLDQIDPGPLEEEIVLDELKAHPEYQSEWEPAPHAYWDDWYQECKLADRIIVNSEWSYDALVRKGVERHKIEIIPLTYSIPQEAKLFRREYPQKFDHGRPLRLLFLGQVILRKGIARIIEAARRLAGEPVEFTIAGPIGIRPLPDLPNLKWVGRIPRLEVEKYFKRADVFLFPTLSDGFGLTQLEARGWKLPLIVSENCGKVVRDQIDGWRLKDVSASSIEMIIRNILQHPEMLRQYSANIVEERDAI